MESATLWEAYQKKGDPAARERLLSRHLRLVHHVARQLVRTLHVEREFDDLVSAGTIGLIKAIENFEPSRGLAFSTFAAPRIRGAILDDLRRWDHAPRSVRRKQRQINSVREALMGALDRPPDAKETAEALGIDVEKLWRWEQDAEEAVQVSLDRPLETEDGTQTTPLDVLIGEDGEQIEQDVNRTQELELLRREILTLKERERVVLSLYYFEELKLHQIAKILHLTESRVSQIRSKAIGTLRDRLATLREESVS
ncbi:MAG TPA: FliA/WhiG family RNA polymerase sigma factor [Longimicrobiales bacterium]